jgi:hypothetical protein
MATSDWTRREMLKAAGIAAGATLFSERFASAYLADQTVGNTQSPLRLNWLDSTPPTMLPGTTVGIPWPRGTIREATGLSITNADGGHVASHASPLAFWPDGSLKWTSHTLLTTDAKGPFTVAPGETVAPATPLKIERQGDSVHIDTGLIRCVMTPGGANLFDTLERQGKPIASNAKLVALRQDAPSDAEEIKVDSFESRVEKIGIEQESAVRCVIRIDGTHTGGGREWLPFTVRLYFHAGSDSLRIMHTFIWDGDEKSDFLRGLGVRFDVPMRDEPHDRHIRLVGEEHGLFGEAVRPLTGLRRDPGEAVKRAQVAGEPTPPISTWPQTVSGRLEWIPTFGDFTLFQSSADGFQIRKRTKPGHAWLAAGTGKRAAGVGYVGSISGGLAFGMRDFWQKHPAQLDIRNAATETAQVTMWLVSPDAPAMDLRFFHDGLGQDTYAKQIEALNITYEDYEDGYGTPHGIARTSEMYLWAVSATPSRQTLVEFADGVRKPAQLVCEAQRFLDAGVFAKLWSPPDRSTPLKAALEDELAFTLDAYLREIDQRSWYGFWDYGDVMHTYDEDRHVWRYDIGGYGWDNSELSPDLWLWYSFLRTGRADIYRFAEAMTRHTGEVDVYHAGRFRFLGTRHGVQHWADSSKQIRVSTAIYRRHLYYLSGGDERIGDLLKEQLLAADTQKKVIIGRKLSPGAPVLPLPAEENPPAGGETGVGAMGFGHLMSAWITEAERTNDPQWHERIRTALTTIAEVPHALWNGKWVINLDTGACRVTGDPEYGLSHLSACFGLPEICAELIATYGDVAPKFADVWADYGILYNASREEQEASLGTSFRNASLRDHHARCTAYAAWLRKDEALAKRAWGELLGDGNLERRKRWQTVTKVEGPDVLNPIQEARLGTNGAAQTGLAIMQCLALVGEHAPE